MPVQTLRPGKVVQKSQSVHAARELSDLAPEVCKLCVPARLCTRAQSCTTHVKRTIWAPMLAQTLRAGKVMQETQNVPDARELSNLAPEGPQTLRAGKALQ